MLDHAEPVRESDAAGQRAAERAERGHVIALDEQQVLAPRAPRLGVECELGAVLAADAREVLAEAHRGALARLAGDPHGTLGPGGRVVDAADEVPSTRGGVRCAADAAALL